VTDEETARPGKIETLIRERMETLRPVLSEAAQPVLSRGACTLPAYVLRDGEPGRCRYCFYHPDGEEAADAYATFVLRQPRDETVKDGGVWRMPVRLRRRGPGPLCPLRNPHPNRRRRRVRFLRG
jgi:hypothetical protein